MARRLTPEQRATVVRLLRDGLRAPEIAAQVGCSASLVPKIAAQEGIALQTGRPGGRRHERADAQRQEAIRLRLEGHDVGEIAAVLGLSRRSILLYLGEIDMDESP